MKVRPGQFREQVAFDAPVEVPDGYGGMVDGWAEQVQTGASYRWLRGGETVQAARLAGRQPVVVTIRRYGATEAIATDWRMRDRRTEEVFAVRAIAPTDDHRFLEVTCESGVAA